MGGMIFDPGTLSVGISEQVGYKSGIALSIEAMCDFLADTKYADLIVDSEEYMVRIRSEEYEELFFKLLHRIGHTEEQFTGDYTGAYIWHKYKDHRDVVSGVTELFVQMWPILMKETEKSGGRSIDPTPFIHEAHSRYGRLGLDIAYERIMAISRGSEINPHSIIRRVDWKEIKQLEALFKGSDDSPEYGRFIDQRFIDYLSNNPHHLGTMHWRKFEELTAEYFQRQGYSVELGPGRNDEGVDVRIWHPEKSPTDSPSAIIQCKRQKEKVQKVIVKGLFADVLFEDAQYGLIVTSSELSPGSRNTILARGYPIEEVNHEMLTKWLSELRTPGTGIVRV